MNKPAKKINKLIKYNKFSNEPSPVLIAVEQLASFVKPTLGPKIHHILVDMGYKTELMDDGVSIAQEIELEDPFENAVIEYVKEVAKKTDDRAGDGTTTTMILLEALLKEMLESGKNYATIKDELAKAQAESIALVQKKSKKIESEEELYKVAKTSYNDDEIAKIIAKILYEIGSDGAITITDWTGKGVEIERLEGFVIPRGFIARGMVTDIDRQKFIAPNANFSGQVGIAVVNDILKTQEDILPILEAADRKGIKNLLIICSNLIGEAMGLVAQAKIRGLLNIAAVQIPGQGEKIKDYIQDICVVTGATEPLDRFNEDNFGFADRVEVSKDDTFIIGGKGNKDEIISLIIHLKERVEEFKEEYDRAYYFQRQARLQSGVVVIKVGGLTDTEINLKLKKIEDAVNACKCALEEGVVPGGGVSYLMETSSEILNKALQAPIKQLFSNSQVDKIPQLKDGEAFNLLTGQQGNYLEVGVVDATKVLRTAIENAISIATILFSIAGIITIDPE